MQPVHWSSVYFLFCKEAHPVIVLFSLSECYTVDEIMQCGSVFFHHHDFVLDLANDQSPALTNIATKVT